MHSTHTHTHTHTHTQTSTSPEHMTRVHTPGCPSVSSSCSASCCYFRGAAGGWMKCLPARRHGMCLACVLRHSVVSDSATPRTVDHQAPLSMAFSRQEYQSGLPCPPPRHLPNPGIEPVSPVYLALAGGLFTIEPSGKPLRNLLKVKELVPCELVFESEISNSRVRALEKHVPMPACFG